jgi:hypothetical protein
MLPAAACCNPAAMHYAHAATLAARAASRSAVPPFAVVLANNSVCNPKQCNETNLDHRQADPIESVSALLAKVQEAQAYKHGMHV